MDKMSGSSKTALNPAKKGMVMILMTANDFLIALRSARKKGADMSHPAIRESKTIKDQVKVFVMA